MKSFVKVLGLIDKGIEKLAIYLLIISITLMLSLSTFAVVLRWLETSLLWIPPMVRHIVFFSAFLGGVLATGARRHIGIDILGRVLGSKNLEKPQKIVQWFVDVICLGTLIWLIFASVEFSGVEFQYGKLSFLGIHSGALVALIPLGFILIAYRYFYLVMAPLLTKEK